MLKNIKSHHKIIFHDKDVLIQVTWILYGQKEQAKTLAMFVITFVSFWSVMYCIVWTLRYVK